MITFTPLGDTLNVAIVDGNFVSIETLFRSSLQKSDFDLSKFSRFIVRRYVSGKIVSVDTFANPYRGQNSSLSNGVVEQFDITYKEASEDCGNIATTILNKEDGAGGHAYEMELLGRPGPSFYYSFQEDSRDPAVVLAGVAGWPPTQPLKRYDESFCFSRWLTVPWASTREYVAQPCIARIHAMCKVSSHFYPVLREVIETLQGVPYIYKERTEVHGRFSIVVDTNPNLYTDEFANTNPNINGAFCSWKIVEDITRKMAQREVIELWTEVALKGGRYYNFSMKFKDAATHGWVDRTFMAPAWRANRWEYSDVAFPAAPNLPVLDTVSPSVDDLFPPMWVNLWENCSINVEFIYGRQTANVVTTAHSDFSTKAP